MNLNDEKLAAARPSSMRPNVQFMENVMQNITKKMSRKGHLMLIVRRSPLMTAFAAIAVLALMSGSAYAVSLLWPQLNTRVTKISDDKDHKTIFVEDCSQDELKKRYEISKLYPLADEKVSDLVKAQCELLAVNKWMADTYHGHNEVNSATNSTPGYVSERVVTMPASSSETAASISSQSLMISNHEMSLPITSSTKFIVGAKYASASDIKRGDTVSYVTRDTVKLRNDSDCSPASYHASVLSSSTELLAVIKMRYPASYYLDSQLIEVSSCPGNPSDAVKVQAQSTSTRAPTLTQVAQMRWSTVR